MKKLLTLTAVGAILSAPAIAVQKCVALGGDISCTSSYSSYLGKANWEATCTSNGVSVPIKGIAACSQEAGLDVGYTKFDDESNTDVELLPTVYSNSNYNNKECWCKIISPAISRWVYTGRTYADVADCLYNCAKDCAYMVVDKRSTDSLYVQSSLFEKMSN